MADTYRARIPFESLDPLTIGASDDESKVYREELELEIPAGNLLAAIYPEEPEPVSERDGGGTRGARLSDERPVVRRASGRCRQRRGDHRQPVPPHPRLEASAAGARRDRGGRSRCLRGHARTARSSPSRNRTSSRRSDARTSTGWSSSGSRSSRTSLATRTRTRTSGSHRAERPSGSTTRWRGETSRSRSARRRQTTGATGGGGKLIMPGVVSDETIESNHCNFVPSPQTHYGALAGPMRSDIDEVATMCGLDVHDERAARHAWPRDRAELRLAPSSHRLAIERFNEIYTYETRPRERAGRHRDLRRLRTDRSPLLPHRLGVHVGGLRAQGRRHDHLHEPVSGRAHSGRRLPRPRADGSDEAVHAADARELPAHAPGHPHARRSRCGPAASGCRSTR